MVLPSAILEAFPSSLCKASNKFNMLALDQTNEKKMRKINSLKQECNVQKHASACMFWNMVIRDRRVNKRISTTCA